MEWKNFCPAEYKYLVDDKNYLIAWKDSCGDYSSPHLAYWMEEEGKFFLLHSWSAFPVIPDIFCEVPKLPEVK